MHNGHAPRNGQEGSCSVGICAAAISIGVSIGVASGVSARMGSFDVGAGKALIFQVQNLEHGGKHRRITRISGHSHVFGRCGLGELRSAILL